jgi:2-polyprenyl-3-methyl-5-hydroxy-6-metoxy-1,4-benzoquinol methylase
MVVPKIDWDKDYAAGQWDGCNETDQFPRYILMGGMISLAGMTDLLDVGCGRGLLRRFIARETIKSYTGVDISREALKQVVDPRPNEKFVCARLEDWVPEATFDCIILNEVLYYLQKPELVLQKMDNCLRPGGVMLTSIFQKRSWRSPNKRALKATRQFLGEHDYLMLSDIDLTMRAKQSATWTVILARKPERSA